MILRDAVGKPRMEERVEVFLRTRIDHAGRGIDFGADGWYCLLEGERFRDAPRAG